MLFVPACFFAGVFSYQNDEENVRETHPLSL
jgi:hypothetical protein